MTNPHIAGPASTNPGDTDTANLVQGVLDNNSGALAFTAGDNVYEYGSTSNYTTYYDPTWGQFKNKTYPALGNHEYDTATGVSSRAATDSINYFYPSSLASASFANNERGFYKADLNNNWMLLVLNSAGSNNPDANNNPAPSCSTTSTQYTYARDALDEAELETKFLSENRNS